jgi:hypothetical protein
MIDISLEYVKKIAFMVCIAVIYPFLVSKGFELVKQADKRDEIHRKHYFYTTALAGVCAIIVGSVLKVNFVGAGLILGGLFSIVSGLVYSWGDLPNLFYFLFLLLFFVAVLFGSYRLLVHTKK